MNRVRRVLVLVVLLGFLTPTWSGDLAQAGHENMATSDHEPPPKPPDLLNNTLPNTWDASCVISNGFGRGTPAIGQQVHQHVMGHNQNAGGWTSCADIEMEFESAHHFTFATGSDGPGECDGIALTHERCHTSHGARSDAGWSHSSCYDDDAPKGSGECGSAPDPNYPYHPPPNLYDGEGDPLQDGCVNCGEFVFPESSEIVLGFYDDKGRYTDSHNWMKFCRGVYDLDEDGVPDCSTGMHTSTGGSHVLVWGGLKDRWMDEWRCFVGELTLMPGALQPTPETEFVYSGYIHFYQGSAYCRG